ncbi:MAG: hypothetical protein ACXW30_05985 [Micavibrio sp.]
MIHRLHVEKEDFDHLEEIKPLVSAFNRAVQFTVAATPEGREKIAAVTTPADNQEFMEIVDCYQIFAADERCYDTREANILHAVLTMSLKDQFMSVIRRAVPDEQLRGYVPDALATERNAVLLDKYKLPALAAIVRSASSNLTAN